MLCGAMLLACEREDGTLVFLDNLPRLRRQLWAAKCLAGLGLVLAQAAAVTAIAAGLGILDGSRMPAAGAAGLAVVGVTGLGWGLLFSANGASVLDVVGRAIGGQILFGFVFYVFFLGLRFSLGEPKAAGVALLALLPVGATAAAFA